MNVSSRTEHDDDPHNPATSGRGFGWRRPTKRQEPGGAAPEGGTPTRAARRRADRAARRGRGAAADRHDRADGDMEDRADADAGVPANDRALVLARRADAVPVRRADGATSDAAQLWVDGLRPANLPLGSPRDLLRFAKEAKYNLAHIDAVRAANIVFVALIAAPVIMGVSVILWAFFVQLHRALTFCVITLVVAPFVNRLADWLVPDGLDASTWSASTWQWVTGCVAAFAVATTVVLVRGRRR